SAAATGGGAGAKAAASRVTGSASGSSSITAALEPSAPGASAGAAAARGGAISGEVCAQGRDADVLHPAIVSVPSRHPAVEWEMNLPASLWGRLALRRTMRCLQAFLSLRSGAPVSGPQGVWGPETGGRH